MKDLLSEIKENKKKFFLFLFVDLLIVPLGLIYLLRIIFADIPNVEEIFGFTFKNFLASGINCVVFHYILYKSIYTDTLKKRDLQIFNIMAFLSLILYGCGVYATFNSNGEMGIKVLSAFFTLIIPHFFFMLRDIMARKIDSEANTYFI